MTLGTILNSAFFAWGLAGLLMLILAGLAFLRKRQMVGERAAIFVIVLVMVLALLALTLNTQ